MPQALFEPSIVAAVLDKDFDKPRKIAEEKWPEGDWKHAAEFDVEWVDEGAVFLVRYDEDQGFEWVRLARAIIAEDDRHKATS